MGQSPNSDSYNDEQIGIPLIQGNADCKNRKTLPRNYTTEKTKECFIDDIIMTVRAPVGAISISSHNACIGRGVCAIKSNNTNSYLYHFLVKYEQRWGKYSQGSTFTAVNSSDIKSLKIPLPPLKEQEKIANILTIWDDAISIQNELIKAKEELKKGLMQKLLSGEVRFEGFFGEWEDKKLGEILKIGSGKDYKHLDNGIIPVYGTGGYMLSVNKYLYDGESVCIGRKGTIDKPMLLSGKFWTVDTLFYTHSYKNSIPKILYFTFLQINWKKYNEASGVPSLSKTTIETIKIKLPSLQEQQKIAEILINANKEINLLKNELEELKEQKKGLMQKLLTGEVRVKI